MGAGELEHAEVPATVHREPHGLIADDICLVKEVSCEMSAGRGEKGLP
jgi:hypothetical protein